jgi:hypothetical protein
MLLVGPCHQAPATYRYGPDVHGCAPARDHEHRAGAVAALAEARLAWPRLISTTQGAKAVVGKPHTACGGQGWGVMESYKPDHSGLVSRIQALRIIACTSHMLLLLLLLLLARHRIQPHQHQQHLGITHRLVHT